MIRFGQVAKFRCRNNTAYRNFVDSCFKEIATTKTEGEYNTLKAEVETK